MDAVKSFDGFLWENFRKLNIYGDLVCQTCYLKHLEEI